MTKLIGFSSGGSSKDLDEAIKTLFANGGLPATPFATKALMTASALVDGDYAMVTDDTANNGLYVKTAGVWVKSAYDPLAQAKIYTDTNLESFRYNYLAAMMPSRAATSYPAEYTSSGLNKATNAGGLIYDTVNAAIYLPNLMVTFDAVGNTISTAAQYLPWGLTDYSANPLMYLRLNKVTKLFRLDSSSVVIPDADKKNLVLCAIIKRDSTTTSVTCNGDYTIDYGINGAITSNQTAEIFTGGIAGRNLPNYDTITHILKLQQGTVLKFGDVSYTVPTNGIEINCLSASELSSAANIYWNLATNTFVVKKLNTKLTYQERHRFVRIASVKDLGITTTYTAHWSGYVGLDINVAYTVNGIDLYEVASKGSLSYQDFAESFCAGSPSGPQPNLPNYNTVTHNLEFAADTILIYKSKTYIIPTGGVTVSCVDPANLSSAVRVYWNTANNTFAIRKYNSTITATEQITFVRVASIRDFTIVTPTTAHWSKYLSIDTSMLYTINGIHPYYNSEQTGGGNSNSIAKYIAPDNNIRGVNHRGWNMGIGSAPENTIPAFKMSKQKGFRFVETDIRWSSDGVPFLIHDTTLDRTSNLTGNPELLTMAQLKEGDFGSWKGAEWAGTKVPTLEEFLTYCHIANLHPYVEWTPTSEVTEDKVNTFVDIVKRSGMYGKITLISFMQATLISVLEKYPELRVGVNSSTPPSSSYVRNFKASCSTGKNECFINGNKSIVDAAAVKTCRDNGVDLEVWVVSDDASVIAYAEMGLSGITVDSVEVNNILEAYALS